MGYIWPNVEGLNGQVVNSQGPMSEQPARVRHGAAKARGRQKGGEGAIGEQVVVPNASVLEATGLERGGGVRPRRAPAGMRSARVLVRPNIAKPCASPTGVRWEPLITAVGLAKNSIVKVYIVSKLWHGYLH